jgi:small GTP-binding protein
MSIKDTKSDYVFKIILLGDPRVGKTSLLLRYIKNKFLDSYKTTIGVDFLSKQIKFGKDNVKITLWDVAGQGRFASFRNFYYQGSNYVIFVFDITNKESLLNLPSWIEDYKKQMKYVKFCVIGNKSDLEDQRVVEAEEYSKIFPKYEGEMSFFMETSAKTGDNVNKAFEIIITELIEYSKGISG